MDAAAAGARMTDARQVQRQHRPLVNGPPSANAIVMSPIPAPFAPESLPDR